MDQNGDEIFWINIGSKYEISIKELATKISAAVGFKGKILWDNNMPDGTPRKKLDTSIMEFLGWEAKTSLNKGINLTLNHYHKEIAEKIIRD